MGGLSERDALSGELSAGEALKQGPATFSRDRDAGSGRRSRRVFSGLLPDSPSIASNNHRPSPCSRKRGTHPCGKRKWVLGSCFIAQEIVLTTDFGTDQWDLIFYSHLLHHFDEASNEELLRRAARALHFEGVLVVLDAYCVRLRPMQAARPARFWTLILR